MTHRDLDVRVPSLSYPGRSRARIVRIAAFFSRMGRATFRSLLEALIFTAACITMVSLLHAQATNSYRVPLVYGYQADPMMVTYNGNYYLYVDDQLGYDRVRTSKSLAGLASAESQLLNVTYSDGMTSVACVYMFHWNSNWYQYCGSNIGNVVLESATDDPLSSYSLAGVLGVPPGFSGGYAEWPFQVGSQIYMVVSVNTGTQNEIFIATASNPYTISGSWNLLASPSGSWECADFCTDEGGSAVVHGSNVFFIFSASTYSSPDYCVGMLTASTSADLTQQSSWTKSSGCVFSRNDSAGVYGPGSMLWFKSPDGTQDWVVYHVKSSSVDQFNGDDRKLEAKQVTWDGSGNPVFGQPFALDTYNTLPSGDPGDELSAPAVSSWGSDRLTVQAVGSSNNIYENWWSSETGWSGWFQVGNAPTNGAALGPALVSHTTNYVDDFVATDSTLQTQYWNGSSWIGWSAFGGPSPSCCLGAVAGSKPSAASWGSDEESVYVLGLNHDVWQNYWSSEAGWSGWVNDLGAPSVGAIGAPAAYHPATNDADLFVRGSDGNLYTSNWNGSAWSSWTNFGGPSSGNASNPALASWGASNLQIYVRGGDGNVYQQTWDGTNWSGTWTSLGQPSVGAVSDPAAYSRTTNWIDVFVRGADGHIYQDYWNGSTWNGWYDFGEP